MKLTASFIKLNKTNFDVPKATLGKNIRERQKKVLRIRTLGSDVNVLDKELILYSIYALYLLHNYKEEILLLIPTSSARIMHYSKTCCDQRVVSVYRRSWKRRRFIT